MGKDILVDLLQNKRQLPLPCTGTQPAFGSILNQECILDGMKYMIML